MAAYLLAHDLGTSGNKATLYDETGALRASAVTGYQTHYGAGGVVEQSPKAWWEAVCGSTKELLERSGAKPAEIAAVTFSGQMMGCLLVDAAGEPLRDAIIWADTRAQEEEAFFQRQISMERVYRITGHRISASYSAAKLLWIKNHEPELYAKADKMIHAKDYIVSKLTGRIVTDYSDASGTNLFDLRGKCWSAELVGALGLKASLLPELCKSTEIVGAVTEEAAKECGLLAGTKVVLGGGDGCCAATGAGAVEEGTTYNVLGSSSWIACASREPVYDPLLRTFTWAHLDPELYSPCGTMQAAGNSFTWMKKNLFRQEAAASQDIYAQIDEAAASSAPGSGGVLFLPYLLGERSPRWNAKATGAFVGMKMTTDNASLCRSVLEGVGYNLKVILDSLESQMEPIQEIILIGGGAQSKVWPQILSDIWQKPVRIPRFLEEATSMGAAVCGGVGVGMFRDFKVVHQFNRTEKTLTPNAQSGEAYRRMYDAFNRCYEALLPVYEELTNCAAFNGML